MLNLKKYLCVDWVLILSALALIAAGLAMMSEFGAGNGYFVRRQLIWVVIGLAVFFIFSFMDWRFLRQGEILLAFFCFLFVLLVALLVFGKITRGTSSWINLPFLSIEPAEAAKLVLILILAKYFSRRHIEIAYVRHIIVSGVYLALLAALVLFQPDFGSALILSLIWFGMIMASGIKKRHLLLVFLTVAVIFAISWVFILRPYQKQRVASFLNPLKDVRNAGYNARQSVIAVGSGKVFGKGVGFGTQSRLEFLPEHQTDFIFAAFAEEWGFVGVLFIFIFYGLILWRILTAAALGQTNFETLFGIGIFFFLAAHFFVHVGMNLGLLPITGVGLPFMSYGGSNLVIAFTGLGILSGMKRYSREAHPDDMTAEFMGIGG